MNKTAWKRKGIAALLFAALGLSLLANTAGAAAKTTQVNVQTKAVQLVFDGKTLSLPTGQHVFSINGTNYVPVRFISYALQKNVGWNDKTKTVTVSDPTKPEAVMLNEFLMNLAGEAGKPSSKGGLKLLVTPVQAKFVFDGSSKSLPKGQSAYNVNGSIYVPIRFMSESIGTDIGWDGKSGRITAVSPAYKKEQEAAGAENGEGDGKEETSTGGTATGGGSSGSAKPTLESITASTEARLHTLESSCQNTLMNIALSAFGQSAEEKAKIRTQGQKALDQCKAQFETIVTNAENQLTTNGYSTAIIAEYRKYFQEQLDAGKAIFDSL
ncbi:copper amine oxidase N-terminal domain-containing protein [Cohnella faecalis]|uniref:Copper amine oxidase N-terminal domain-containing protein n=1 Tax=Cohnella faecalis TaxID=2315694 RepID=A0A398CYK7_9BACL|nr:copper amine oxidase N-terminal domain-containing protein [Cohnella faecalis]RIE04311.1 copper amine oxidase N-terminal domain-containing protein [Cohnella faecalis]